MSDSGRAHFLGWAQAFVESAARVLAAAEGLDGPAAARVLTELRGVAERQAPLPADGPLHTLLLDCLETAATALSAGDEASLREVVITLRGAQGMLAATAVELGLDLGDVGA